jgi:hypothetical protein
MGSGRKRRQEGGEATPPGVEVRTTPRPAERDPTLGIPVEVDRDGEPPNRLVTIGDSITQGFMSAAVFRTDRSWPAIVAHELGLRPQVGFRYPTYEPPDGPGGLPLDLERMARGLQRVVGERLDWYELLKAARWLQRHMDRIEDYWEGRGDRTFVPATPDGPYHNLAVYGADLLDVQALDLAIVEDRLAGPVEDDLLSQVVERDNDRAWKVVLDSLGDSTATVLDGARAMGEEGSASHGIETLVVVLGANNALGSILKLRPRWTPDDYLDDDLPRRLVAKSAYNVWQPAHFAEELGRLVEQVKAVRARHTLLATVPQVTIAPIARGVRGKVRADSRFFPYYTRPWIDDEDFDVDRDPWIDEQQARGIDSAIDSFNEAIIEAVRRAREDGLDWYLFDFGALLDSVAVKRYLSSPEAQPDWWRPYEFPPELAGLQPPLDTRFFAAGPGGRTQGGLFSLDGVHPTTTAAGLVAREVVRIMDRDAGVPFRDRAGDERPRGTVDVDFTRVLGLDTLNAEPPAVLGSTMSLMGWFDEKVDWLRRLPPFG